MINSSTGETLSWAGAGKEPTCLGQLLWRGSDASHSMWPVLQGFQPRARSPIEHLHVRSHSGCLSGNGKLLVLLELFGVVSPKFFWNCLSIMRHHIPNPFLVIEGRTLLCRAVSEICACPLLPRPLRAVVSARPGPRAHAGHSGEVETDGRGPL